jgi:hypothetical protein
LIAVFCSELVGHEVELEDEHGDYRLATVRQANVNVAANLLRFTGSRDKQWIDMATQNYKLVSRPPKTIDIENSICMEVEFDATLYGNHQRSTNTGACSGSSSHSSHSSSRGKKENIKPTSAHGGPSPKGVWEVTPAPDGVGAGTRDRNGADTSQHATSNPSPAPLAPKPSRGSRKLPGLRDALSHAQSLNTAANAELDHKNSTGADSNSSSNSSNSISSTASPGSTMSTITHTMKATITTNDDVDEAEEVDDEDEEDEDDEDEEEEEDDDRTIEIESYVYHAGQKKMKKSKYTKEDLAKKMETNPKYADDWKKLIDQFDRKWQQQRKIFVESYVYQSGKKTMKKKEYTTAELEEKKVSQILSLLLSYNKATFVAIQPCMQSRLYS